MLLQLLDEIDDNHQIYGKQDDSGHSRPLDELIDFERNKRAGLVFTPLVLCICGLHMKFAPAGKIWIHARPLT